LTTTEVQIIIDTHTLQHLVHINKQIHTLLLLKRRYR